MIIYNREWLDNLAIINTCRKWMKSNFISTDEFEKIKSGFHTQYHDSNIFIRLGMFILTVIAASAIAGFANVMHHFPILAQLIISTIVLFYCAELYFSKRNFYRSGVTDAFLYMGISAFCSTIIYSLYRMSIEIEVSPLMHLIPILPIFIIAGIRYVDSFLVLIAFLLLIVINALLVLKLGYTGKLILPFETMAVSLLVYFFIRKFRANEKYRFWENCISTTETASLVTLYLAGNYLVVRQLSEILLDAEIQEGSDIAFAYIFYAYTIIVPLVYVWLGLKKKDYIFIRTGIILEVVGILSIRYYYSIMPAESAMILGGTFLTIIAWLSIKYLKTPKHGITCESDEFKGETVNVLSSMVISQAASSNLRSHDASTRLGGGESGGGGAGGGF